MSEIINRVAASNLVTFDLEAFYPAGERRELDISDWLYEGIVLKEKDFRKSVSAHNWKQYQNCYVALFCASEAIIPAWAYMLITTQLQPYAKKVVPGNLEALESALFELVLNEADLGQYKDKPVIIKGCSNKPVPVSAYVLATSKLQEVARSIFYGEACSSVPLYKRK